jgi:hypothetical protein
VVSLLARLPLPGQRVPGDRGPAYPAALAAAATAAVTLLGLVGLGLAVVVVQALDPAGGLPVGGSTRVGGQLWLLANGGGLVLPSGPLVLAPLLLTLAVAFGLARAGRGVARLAEPSGAGAAAVVVAAGTATHVLLTVLLALAVDGPGARSDVLRCAAGAAVLALVAVGWGRAARERPARGRADRLPGPVRPLLPAVLAGCATPPAAAYARADALVRRQRRDATQPGAPRRLRSTACSGLLARGALRLPHAAARSPRARRGPASRSAPRPWSRCIGVSSGRPALPRGGRAARHPQGVPLLRRSRPWRSPPWPVLVTGP